MSDASQDNPIEPVRLGLVSVSDRASQGVYRDEGLPALEEWLGKAVASPPVRVVRRLIPDERGASAQPIAVQRRFHFDHARPESSHQPRTIRPGAALA